MRLIHEGVRLGFRYRGGLLHRRCSFLGGGGAGASASASRRRASSAAASRRQPLDHGALGLVRACRHCSSIAFSSVTLASFAARAAVSRLSSLAPRPLAATLALVLHVFPAEGPLTRDALAPDVDPGGERAEPFAARRHLAPLVCLFGLDGCCCCTLLLLRLLLLLLLRRPGGHARAPGCRPVVVGAEGNGGHAPVVVHSRRARAGEEQIVEIHCRRRRVTATP